MKKNVWSASVILMLLCNSVTVKAQVNRAITTAVPFLLISSDARASGLADQGVATSPDAYSQQWNPSKYVFSDRKIKTAISYTPYLGKLVNDIGLLTLAGAYKIDERSVVSGGLRYFSLGEIEFTNNTGVSIGGTQVTNIQKPNEMCLDASYALKLSPNLSGAVTARYIRSDLKLQEDINEARAGNAFGVDLSAYYRGNEVPYQNFNGRFVGGINISNIGPKIKYNDTDQGDFLPTKFALGGGYDFMIDQYNTITPYVEFTKLLVPTPTTDGGIGTDVSSFGALFSSWFDAPNGMSEEIAEFTFSVAGEYRYQDVFALRLGYFNESNMKGARKHMTFGAGIKYSSMMLDVSYLYSVSQTVSPLEGTLRFGLTLEFGEYFDNEDF